MSYHIANGVHIERTTLDGVRIFKADPTDPNIVQHGIATMTASEWASVVASVSPGGETTESYYAALGFHEGKTYDHATGAVRESFGDIYHRNEAKMGERR